MKALFMKGLLGLALVGCLATAAPAKNKAPTLRDQEQAACYNDAMRLCGDFVPDEAKITACMTEKKSQVGPACLKFFGKHAS